METLGWRTHSRSSQQAVVQVYSAVFSFFKMKIPDSFGLQSHDR
jgi:hypothetical protein